MKIFRVHDPGAGRPWFWCQSTHPALSPSFCTSASLLLAALLVLNPSPATADQATERDGVSHQVNSAEPEGGIETITLTEVWRIGGQDDEENLFGIINDVLVDDDNNLHLLDIQLVEVQIFTPSGEYVRSLGRRGSGPGELRSLSGALFMPDGTLGMFQTFPGQIVTVELDGTPAGDTQIGGDDPTRGGMVMLRAVASRGDSLVVGGMRMAHAAGERSVTQFIGTMGFDGGLGTVYRKKSSIREMGRMQISETDDDFPHNGRWALGPDGRVWIAPERNEYLIHVYYPDGSLERTIERPFSSWQRTAAETERALALLQPRRGMRHGGRRRPTIELKVAETEPDIVRLQITAAGELWVQSSRSTRQQPAGTLVTYDIFDSTGHFIRQTAVVCPGLGTRDALFFAGPDHFVLVTGHAEALLAWRGAAAEDETEDMADIPLEVIYYRK